MSKEDSYDLTKDSDEKLLEAYNAYWYYAAWRYQRIFTKSDIAKELTRRGIEVPKTRK